MLIHGYIQIDNNYYLDYETTHFFNNIDDIKSFFIDTDYGNETIKLFNHAINHGLNENNYVICCIDEQIIIFDKNYCFTSDLYEIDETEQINDFDKWVNNSFNMKNVEIIKILLNVNGGKI